MSDVFNALSDPTRRAILEHLRESGALSLTQISEVLPISRQAVTKHLNVLEAAGLIERRTEGRERFHRLSAAPLKQVDDWLTPYAAAWDERLERLRSHLGDNPRGGTDD